MRRELRHRVLAHQGQSFQHVLEIAVGLDALDAAGFDQAVDERATLPGILMAEEQVVLLFMVSSP